MINNEEHVAQAIFSPRMIINGELQTEAFQLRASIGEKYISVMRMGIASWLDDVMLIPQRKNRQLYGYAEMPVESIREASFHDIIYDVKECDNTSMKAHAGIFITVSGQQLIGGKRIESITNDSAQDFLLLLIQRRLVEIARKGIRQIM